MTSHASTSALLVALPVAGLGIGLLVGFGCAACIFKDRAVRCLTSSSTQTTRNDATLVGPSCVNEADFILPESMLSVDDGSKRIELLYRLMAQYRGDVVSRAAQRLCLRLFFWNYLNWGFVQDGKIHRVKKNPEGGEFVSMLTTFLHEEEIGYYDLPRAFKVVASPSSTDPTGAVVSPSREFDTATGTVRKGRATPPPAAVPGIGMAALETEGFHVAVGAAVDPPQSPAPVASATDFQPERDDDVEAEREFIRLQVFHDSRGLFARHCMVYDMGKMLSRYCGSTDGGFICGQHAYRPEQRRIPLSAVALKVVAWYRQIGVQFSWLPAAFELAEDLSSFSGSLSAVQLARRSRFSTEGSSVAYDYCVTTPNPIEGTPIAAEDAAAATVDPADGTPVPGRSSFADSMAGPSSNRIDLLLQQPPQNEEADVTAMELNVDKEALRSGRLIKDDFVKEQEKVLERYLNVVVGTAQLIIGTPAAYFQGDKVRFRKTNATHFACVRLPRGAQCYLAWYRDLGIAFAELPRCFPTRAAGPAGLAGDGDSDVEEADATVGIDEAGTPPPRSSRHYREERARRASQHDAEDTAELSYWASRWKSTTSENWGPTRARLKASWQRTIAVFLNQDQFVFVAATAVTPFCSRETAVSPPPPHQQQQQPASPPQHDAAATMAATTATTCGNGGDEWFLSPDPTTTGPDDDDDGDRRRPHRLRRMPRRFVQSFLQWFIDIGVLVREGPHCRLPTSEELDELRRHGGNDHHPQNPLDDETQSKASTARLSDAARRSVLIRRMLPPDGSILPASIDEATFLSLMQEHAASIIEDWRRVQRDRHNPRRGGAKEADDGTFVAAMVASPEGRDDPPVEQGTLRPINTAMSEHQSDVGLLPAPTEPSSDPSSSDQQRPSSHPSSSSAPRGVGGGSMAPPPTVSPISDGSGNEFHVAQRTASESIRSSSSSTSSTSSGVT